MPFWCLGAQRKGMVIIMDYEDTDFVTIGEIMEKLSVCRNTVYTLLKRKEIDSFKIGRVWKVPYYSLEKFIKENSSKKSKLTL